jgi:hypothetical protein
MVYVNIANDNVGLNNLFVCLNSGPSKKQIIPRKQEEYYGYSLKVRGILYL